VKTDLDHVEHLKDLPCMFCGVEGDTSNRSVQEGKRADRPDVRYLYRLSKQVGKSVIIPTLVLIVDNDYEAIELSLPPHVSVASLWFKLDSALKVFTSTSANQVLLQSRRSSGLFDGRSGQRDRRHPHRWPSGIELRERHMERERERNRRWSDLSLKRCQ
jgi:hypothetical protein